ncbi:VOC family protein [Paenibacillus oenotherae]|uniref:VOC family protein n=1 Tax=Paenibacillus oenotherae TaxID=1435645 RepID=A0ABS7D7K0_9BACL|nr:VOC family protein [Paenibacillus oenotherae]MBW7475506.1 VOC family protein [Paenibacillus oenotherae]
MPSVSPFVVVDNCQEEIEYYRSVLGGEITILRKQEDKVLNAELHFESTKITFADTIAARPSLKGNYVKVMLKLDTEEQFGKVYEELTTGGHINVEKYEAPFNGLLAIITDRNGIGWVLSYYRD